MPGVCHIFEIQNIMRLPYVEEKTWQSFHQFVSLV